MPTTIFKIDIRARDKVTHRACDEDLVRTSHGRNPCRDVDGDAGEVLTTTFTLAGVDSSPDLHTELVRARNNRLGASNRPSRTIEASDKPISGRVDLLPSEHLKLASNHAVMKVQ